jgi:hypothetical protein
LWRRDLLYYKVSLLSTISLVTILNQKTKIIALLGGRMPMIFKVSRHFVYHTCWVFCFSKYLSTLKSKALLVESTLMEKAKRW